ncbi:hypothetical protein PG990_010122 [Apiospora arundinis]
MDSMDIDQPAMPAKPVARDLIRWMLGMYPSIGCPREIFDSIVGYLSMVDQLSLATTNVALRKLVVPVFDGWVWSQPTMSFTNMMAHGRMQWPFLAQAEQQAANGYVACPWCRKLHDPVEVVLHNAVDDPAPYACREVERNTYETESQRLVSLYERPYLWNPLVLLGFIRKTLLGRNLTLLRNATSLDCHRNSSVRTVTLEDGTTAPEVYQEEQWKTVWQPSHGLFLRQRVMEICTPEDSVGSLEMPCCPCERNRKIINYDPLFREKFNEALYTEFQPGTKGINPVVRENMLSEEGRLSYMLVAGPVRGCEYCGIDWQAAWRLRDEQDGGMLIWTTWFFLGKPTTLPEMLEAVKDRHNRDNEDSVPVLGVGNVARLSGLVDDYL